MKNLYILLIAKYLLILLLPFLLFGCATNHLADNNLNQDQNIKDHEEFYDPWEGMNRKFFWFNERLDQNIFGPVAQGYDYVTPQFMQTGFTNFFTNLEFPTRFTASVFQLEFSNASKQLARFLLNTTVGILGFVDVASDVGINDKREDFGKTFANWGISEGPYLVLPFLGPSNVRNTVGRVFDVLTSPSFLLQQTNASSDFKFWWPIGSNALELINLRNNLDDGIKAGREGSLDFYLFQRSSYLQMRRGMEFGKDSDISSSLKGASSSDIEDDIDAILSKGN